MGYTTNTRRFVTTAALAALLAALAGCSAQSQPDQAPVTRPQPVQTGRVTVIDTDRRFALSGVVRAAERAQLAFQVGGRLVERPAAIGEKVARGDLLARLENPELVPAAAAARAAVARLETQLAQAGRDAARVAALFNQGAATKQELESVTARKAALAASLRQARAQSVRAASLASETRLMAPVAGTITAVYFEPGETVPAGAPVVALSGAGGLEVEIGLPEILLDDVALGDAVALTLPIVGGTTGGRITRLASAAGGIGELFPAVISLKAAPGLRPGVTVTWRMRSDEPARLSVPIAAIASTGGRGQPKVYRIAGDQAQAVPVTLGAVVGERVVVAGELAAGQRVVTLGLGGLIDGRAVAPQQ